MFDESVYQLLDFGDGRKLERFGSLVLDRPAPVADSATKADPERWSEADARYERFADDQGQWHGRASLPETWCVGHGEVTFQLRRTPFGHVGLFSEQAANWDWIARRVVDAGRPLKILNLFAYTGGSTLAAAAAGGAETEVVHVDAAKNVVAWARQNAEQSGLGDAPIRWIVEDVMRFVQREVKRGNQYDAVILDPPSYGRGPKGQVFTFAKQLPKLLDRCVGLLSDEPSFLLLTHHTTTVPCAQTVGWLKGALGEEGDDGLESGRMQITAASGRQLPSGFFARWSEDWENRT